MKKRSELFCVSGVEKNTGQLIKLLVYILRYRDLRSLLNCLLFKESIVEQGKAYQEVTTDDRPLQLHDLGPNPGYAYCLFWVWLLLSKRISRNNVSWMGCFRIHSACFAYTLFWWGTVRELSYLQSYWVMIFGLS